MKKILLLICIIIACILLYPSSDDKVIDPADTVDDIAIDTSGNTSDSTDVNKTVGSSSSPAISGKKLSKKDLPDRIETPQTENESQDYLAETLFQFTNYDKTQEDLVEDLERLNLNPTQTKTNNSLGTSNTIRTEKSLKGTRYFHAQFKGDGNGNEILQHMSFELPPGPESFTDGIAKLAAKYKLPSKMKIDTPEFKAWSLDNGYVVWVKKLTQKDLDDNPFNAYEAEDIGTVKLAVEIDIHPAGDHEH